jgi:hypothetical protein
MALRMGTMLSCIGEYSGRNDIVLARCLDDTDGQDNVDNFLVCCFKELIKNPLIQEHTILICIVNYSRCPDRDPEIVSLARYDVLLSKKRVHDYFKNMTKNTQELTLGADPEDPTNLQYASLICSSEDPLKTLASITKEPRHIRVD